MADIVNYIGSERIEIAGAGLHNSSIFRYTIIPDPPIAKSANSAELVLPLPPHAEILGINCQSESDKYDLSFRCRKGITTPNIYEILDITNINLVYSIEFVAGGGSPKVINREMPQAAEIYLIISNDDTKGVPVSTLHLELIVGDM